MPQEAVVNGNLHYIVDNCGGESVNEVIAGNFIDLFRNSPFGMAGGCNGKCTIDNVRVECGNQTKARRRRETPDGKKTFKIPLTVHFSLKVPLPSNALLLDLNQTIQQHISNNLLDALNKTDLNLNVSGVFIKYDSSKPPVFRLLSLVCSEGQVQRETTCGKEFPFTFVFIFGFKCSFTSGQISNLSKRETRDYVGNLSLPRKRRKRGRQQEKNKETKEFI